MPCEDDSFGIGATICIGQKLLCLPYTGFFLYFMLGSSEDLRYLIMVSTENGSYCWILYFSTVGPNILSSHLVPKLRQWIITNGLILLCWVVASAGSFTKGATPSGCQGAITTLYQCTKSLHHFTKQLWCTAVLNQYTTSLYYTSTSYHCNTTSLYCTSTLY